MDGVGIRLYTECRLVSGVTDSGRQRLSDLLNNPNITALELEEASYLELLTEREPQIVGRMTVRKSEVLLAVPLDRPELGGARVETKRIGIELACPFFSITGSMHRRPQDSANLGAVISGVARTFLPVSDATVRYLPNGSFDASLPIVLVDTRRIQFWAVDQQSLAQLRTF
jgi:hypothetical protein